MPIRPLPLEIRCPKCGWHQVWQAASDACVVPPIEQCPHCAYSSLEARQVSGDSALLESALKTISAMRW